MKPHRMKLAHHLVVNYDLYRKMDIFVRVERASAALAAQQKMRSCSSRGHHVALCFCFDRSRTLRLLRRSRTSTLRIMSTFCSASALVIRRIWSRSSKSVRVHSKDDLYSANGKKNQLAGETNVD